MRRSRQKCCPSSNHGAACSFLKNNEKLALGQRQSGRVIGDVELPAWAESAREFLLQHRAALESPSVSANLHHWLDLIFGYGACRASRVTCKSGDSRTE